MGACTMIKSINLFSQNSYPWPQTANVGIGTATPNSNALLEIKKDVPGGLGPVLRLTGGGYAGGQCAIDLTTYEPGISLPSGRIVATDNNFSCSFDFQTKLIGANTNPLQSRLFITSTGEVGIGTTSPQAKLAVNGDIFAKKIKVTSTGWPDYVFHANYRLRPLREVEQYIKKYHHLPEVISAEEVGKNGVDIGDTQASLLKKIEELTLYVIDLNKRLLEHDKQLEVQLKINGELKEQLELQQRK
jgi:hypothetical protein